MTPRRNINGRQRHGRGSLRRRGPVRSPSKLVRIICEGVNTEPTYFRSLIRELRKTSIQLVVTGEGMDPKSLAKLGVKETKRLRKEARKSGNSFDKNYEVWVVFDRDDFPQIHEARALASKNGVAVAMSNPCFEIWCIYHYEDHHAPCSNHECQGKLSQLCDNYHHNGSKLFDISYCESDQANIVTVVNGAIERGNRSLVRREEEGDPLGCPSTEVGKLAEKIINA